MRITPFRYLQNFFRHLTATEQPDQTIEEGAGTEKITEQHLRETFADSADVHVQKYRFGSEKNEQPILLLFCEGMTDTKQINEIVLPRLEQMIARGFLPSGDKPPEEKTLALEKIEDKPLLTKVITTVYAGELVIFFPNDSDLYSVDIADPPRRTPSESNTELSIKGPRDAFTEELTTNVALIRKRLATNSLCHEQFTVGRRSQTKVSLLYIRDIINPEIVEEARTRINKVDIDALHGSPQLEEIIADSTYSLFPLLDYIGRPDFVVHSLVSGRFAILVNGSPMAVIAPANFTLLLKSPEDLYKPFYFVSLERSLRLIGFLVAIFLPGFWVALTTYNVDQLPFPLLATVTLSRIGIPVSVPLEAFLLLGLFELFREAGERLPKAVGGIVAVVGGLIVGEMLVRAGLASSTHLVMAAQTAVATFALVNHSLSGTVSILRIFVLICATFLGMFGFFIASFAIVIHMARLESFKVPYLAPLAPLQFKELFASLFKLPWKDMTHRPKSLSIQDNTRRKDE